jgi:hypothetical protein
MAATVQLLSYHGASPTGTDVAGGSVRFKLADDDAANSLNPIVIPTSGTAYSWVKQFKLNVSAWNTGTTDINNPQVFSGTNTIGTGVDIAYNLSATYLDPTTNMATALSPRTGSIINTAGSPVAITGAGAITNPALGTFHDYVRFQVEVTSAATQGTTPAQTLTLSFDEF